MMMIETCYNRDTSDNRIEVMKVELDAQLFLLGSQLAGKDAMPTCGYDVFFTTSSKEIGIW